MGQRKNKTQKLLSKKEYNTLITFHDIAKGVFGPRIQKMIFFGRRSKTHCKGTLDVLLLFSKFLKKDCEEVSQIAEDLSDNSSTLISPIAMDKKTYKSYKSHHHPLIKDIEKSGCEFPTH